jgi:hypothetical protein
MESKNHIIKKLFDLPAKFDDAFGDIDDISNFMIAFAEQININIIFAKRLQYIMFLTSSLEKCKSDNDLDNIYQNLSKEQLRFYIILYDTLLEYFNFKKEKLK